jgi:hypothetical protein
MKDNKQESFIHSFCIMKFKSGSFKIIAVIFRVVTAHSLDATCTPLYPK